MALLEIDDIHVFYDNIEALKGVSIKVEKKQIVTLVGANGAGKTTTLKAVSGLLRPRVGDIRFDGESLRDVPPHEIATMGVLHVPEGRRIFARLTVAENLAMGAFARRDRRGVAEDRERMLTLFPLLRERLNQVAGTLSGGEQQMVATARALMGAAARASRWTSPAWACRRSWSKGVRNHQSDQRTRGHHPAGRAERADGARHRRRRLCAWKAAGSCSPAAARICSMTRRCSGRISADDLVPALRPSPPRAAINPGDGLHAS